MPHILTNRVRLLKEEEREKKKKGASIRVRQDSRRDKVTRREGARRLVALTMSNVGLFLWQYSKILHSPVSLLYCVYTTSFQTPAFTVCQAQSVSDKLQPLAETFYYSDCSSKLLILWSYHCLQQLFTKFWKMTGGVRATRSGRAPGQNGVND